MCSSFLHWHTPTHKVFWEPKMVFCNLASCIVRLADSTGFCNGFAQVQGKPLVGQVDPDGDHCKRLTEIHGEGIAGAQEVKSLKDSLILVRVNQKSTIG